VRLLCILLLAGTAAGATLRYWVEPCAVPRESGCHDGDPELAAWALEAWQAASGGALHLEPSPKMASAHIRLFWANGRNGLYGEARPIKVDGVRGAEVYVLPEQSTSADALLRDAILYLTCLHETGHALGLQHTARFADIMYSFQYGGDIEGYFGRYRRLLSTRPDIRKNAGMSEDDRKQLRELWK
jgi:Matrixin